MKEVPMSSHPGEIDSTLSALKDALNDLTADEFDFVLLWQNADFIIRDPGDFASLSVALTKVVRLISKEVASGEGVSGVKKIVSSL